MLISTVYKMIQQAELSPIQEWLIGAKRWKKDICAVTLRP
jgi:hypothetical protein